MLTSNSSRSQVRHSVANAHHHSVLPRYLVYRVAVYHSVNTPSHRRLAIPVGRKSSHLFDWSIKRDLIKASKCLECLLQAGKTTREDISRSLGILQMSWIVLRRQCPEDTMSRNIVFQCLSMSSNRKRTKSSKRNFPMKLPNETSQWNAEKLDKSPRT